MISGYEYPNHDKLIQELWGSFQEQMGTFLQIVAAEPTVVGDSELLNIEKHALQLSKLHVQMADTHPAAFALLPNSVELVRAYWALIVKYGQSYGSVSQDFTAKALQAANDGDGTKETRSFMERLSLKGMILIRSCMKMVFKPAQSFKYRSPEIKQEQGQALERLKSQVCKLINHTNRCPAVRNVSVN